MNFPPLRIYIINPPTLRRRELSKFYTKNYLFQGLIYLTTDVFLSISIVEFPKIPLESLNYPIFCSCTLARVKHGLREKIQNRGFRIKEFYLPVILKDKGVCSIRKT